MLDVTELFAEYLMNLINSLTSLTDTVQALLHEFEALKAENALLLRENAELKGQHLSKEEEVVLLKYKNELAKSRIEAIIKRLKAVDQSLADSGSESLPAFLSGQIQQHQNSTKMPSESDSTHEADTTAYESPTSEALSSY